MVKQKRKGTLAPKRWNHFFLNGDLHKTLRTNRTENLLVAWNFKEKRRVAYVLTDAYKRRQRAFSTGQVAKMVHRHRDTVKKHIRARDIPMPQTSMSLDGSDRMLKYYFSEDDVRDIYEFFKTVHRGRPRKDGKTTFSDLPSKAELEASMRNETVLYTKNEDGEFVPVWKQPEW